MKCQIDSCTAEAVCAIVFNVPMLGSNHDRIVTGYELCQEHLPTIRIDKPSIVTGVQNQLETPEYLARWLMAIERLKPPACSTLLQSHS